MKKIWQKIKFWFWWRFIATEHQKVKWDVISKGVGFIKSGKLRIDPDKFLLDEYKTYLTRKKANDFVDAMMYFWRGKTNH